MKLRILLTILLIGLIAYAGMSAAKTDPFAPAKDFPRGALVYTQFSDLPALIKRWNESELKGKYLDSANFKELSNRHLGLKLASRWQEFNDAAGFPFDLEALAGFADGRAAVAVYDIGRLDLVFIAPLSDELFAASKLMRGGTFNEEELDGGIAIYRVKVDADRGRQKQELLFTNCRGRLVIATSEKLLARTVANINSRSRKDRLADDPSFATLAAQTVPHTATVWTDQTALNSDYYFKRYWLMGNVDHLKAIRSGMYDLSMDEGKFTESRRFLLNKQIAAPLISQADIRSAVLHIPDQVSLYSLHTARRKAVADAIDSTISSGDQEPLPKQAQRRFRYQPADYEYTSGSTDYSYLDGSFDERVDETDQDDTIPERNEKRIDISAILATAAPRTVLTMVQPEYHAAPLFAEFKRAAVVRLASPGQFNREAFELAIAKTVSSQVMAAATGTPFEWKTVEGKSLIRQLNLPMLARSVCYALKNDELFISNNPEFLSGVMAGKVALDTTKPSDGVSDLTVLDLGAARVSYREIFGRLSRAEHPDDFFTGNVDGLLNLYPNATKVRITRSSIAGILREELEVMAN